MIWLKRRDRSFNNVKIPARRKIINIRYDMDDKREAEDPEKLIKKGRSIY